MKSDFRMFAIAVAVVATALHLGLAAYKSQHGIQTVETVAIAP